MRQIQIQLIIQDQLKTYTLLCSVIKTLTFVVVETNTTHTLCRWSPHVCAISLARYKRLVYLLLVTTPKVSSD